MSGLFTSLPVFPVALPDDELRLLAKLPNYEPDECVTEIDDADHGACRRLEKRRLVKVHREKMDDLASRPTWFAGKLTESRLKAVPA